MQNEVVVQGYQVSPQQRRLWLLTQHTPSAYGLRATLGVEGALDAQALRRALIRVCERHEALRTRFARRPGMRFPLQVVGGAGEPVWRESDLTELGEAERESRLEALREEEGREPVGGGGDAVVGAHLLKVGAGSHVLELSVSAMCADAESVRVMARELAACYGAELGGDAPDDEPLQYADFSDWQDEQLEGEGEEAEQGREHWRASSDAESTTLPFERRRATTTFAPARVRVGVWEGRALNEAATHAEATEEGWLLACWQTLLWRLGGGHNAAVAERSNGRKYEELAGGVGPYAKWLPVAGQAATGLRFRDLVGQVEEVRRAKAAWQEYFIPAEDVEDGDSASLLSIGFEYMREDAAYEAGGVSLSLKRLRSCTEPFKLKLSCARLRGTLLIELEYDTNVYDGETAARVAGHFKTLLGDALEQPEARLEELRVLSEQECGRLVRDFNITRADYPSDKSFHQLFEARAASDPGRVAVVCGARQLTYAELNERANRLAHYLRRRGVTADACVGLCVERSVESLVGMLGILKAGGAYVPLSEEYPPERLRHQLAEVESPVLLTQEKFRGLFAEFKGEVIRLDSDGALLEAEPATDPEPVCAPECLAYVIYTSGSTGRPKGVAVSHRSLVNYASYICRELGADPGAEPLHFLTVTTFAADLGHTAIFPALLSGGCLHILSQEAATDAHAFADYLARHPIDVLKIVPSHLSALLTSDAGARALPRQFLFLGGEALSPVLLSRIEGLSSGCRVINHYGPTEATVGALVNRRAAERLDGEGPRPVTVPIGRPLANAAAYVLDEQMRPQPLGVAGDLHLGGEGVARGYLRQPAQTAERFVPDPFSGEPGRRLYRTGDLAKVWPDGQIEFAGRADDQVKIRGFRIEPGEIESVLKRHAGITGVAVLAREDESGHKRLVAYVEAASGNAPTVAQLREHVRGLLPEYMVPSVFVLMARLPLTPNGKIDRKALPAPDEAGGAAEKTYAEPQTEVGRTLARIWQEVLRVERVGVNDNFFARGGDSILSIQIVARARQSGLYLTPKQLFQFQTIGELAPAVTTVAPAPSAVQEPATGDVPLTQIQRWFFEQPLENPSHFNQAVLLRVPREAGAELFRGALEGLLEHHDALRMRFERDERGWRQYYAAPGGEVPFVESDLTDVAAGERAVALEAEAARWQRSLDLAEGPLVRAVLFRMGDDEANRLLIVVHHLVMDGVSWRILLEDLQLACEQLGRGETLALPARTSSFKEWAERLDEYARSAEVRAESDYWLTTVGGEAADLPVDLPGGDNLRASARSLSVELDEDETRALLQELPAAYRTEINDALLTALALAVGAWAGRRSLLVEMEGHGREEIHTGLDVTRTVGWFTTHYPVRLSFDGGADRVGALRCVKEQLRAVPRRGIGYGLLRRLRVDEEVALRLLEAVRAEVKFNYLGQMDQSLAAAAGFGLARESCGETQSAGGARGHLLEVNAGVLGGRLFLRWVYSERLYRRETIERLAASCVAELRALVDLCRSGGAVACTSTDFPAALMGQKQFERFLSGVGEARARNLEDLYRLSPMQEGMLFHNMLAPESDIYYRQLNCSLHGRLNVAAFERAWQRVVDEHPVLRTSFHWQGLEVPLQMVHRAAKLPLTVEDWRAVPATEQEQRLGALLESERERNFVLTDPPLMRLVLIRLSEEVHQFVWSYHHLLMDGWAKHEVFNQLLALYRAYDGGLELALAPRRPYREYIAWLQRQDMGEAESFWRRALKGFTRPPTFASARGADAAHGGGSHFDKLQTFLAAETTERLYDFARRHGLTINTAVQGAWSLLLGQHFGREDVVFGAVMSGRPADLEGAEGIIGLFINTLPVRAQMSEEVEAVAWLARLQQEQAEARQYEYSPLVQVQVWSEVPRGQMLFESLLTFENYPIDTAARAQNATVEVRDYRVLENNNYPLTLMVGPGASLSLLLIYDLGRFTRAQAEALQAQLEEFLAALAYAGPETTLREVRERVEAAAKEREARRGEELKGVSLQKFKAVKRKPLRGAAEAAIEAE